MRHGAATTAEGARIAGSTRLSGPCGGAAAAVAHGSAHRPGDTRESSSGAGVGGNRGPATRRVGGPDDSRPVLAGGSELGWVLGSQARRQSWLADLVAGVGSASRACVG